MDAYWWFDSDKVTAVQKANPEWYVDMCVRGLEDILQTDDGNWETIREIGRNALDGNYWDTLSRYSKEYELLKNWEVVKNAEK